MALAKPQAKDDDVSVQSGGSSVVGNSHAGYILKIKSTLFVAISHEENRGATDPSKFELLEG